MVFAVVLAGCAAHRLSSPRLRSFRGLGRGSELVTALAPAAHTCSSSQSAMRSPCPTSTSSCFFPVFVLVFLFLFISILHWYFCFNSDFADSCAVYDYVKDTASPPDHLSYPSTAIVICDTGHTNSRSAWFGFTRIGRKFVVHFSVVFTDIFCGLPLWCVYWDTLWCRRMLRRVFWRHHSTLMLCFLHETSEGAAWFAAVSDVSVARNCCSPAQSPWQVGCRFSADGSTNHF